MSALHLEAVLQGLESLCELLIVLRTQRLEERPLELAREQLHKQLGLAALHSALE